MTFSLQPIKSPQVRVPSHDEVMKEQRDTYSSITNKATIILNSNQLQQLCYFSNKELKNISNNECHKIICSIQNQNTRKLTLPL